MPRVFTLLSFIFISIMGECQATRINIKSLPAHHPAGSDIYIAGSFNGWNPGDEKFKFNKDDKGNYWVELNLAAGTYEYKLTRGSWDKSECRDGGASSPNRILTLPVQSPVILDVEEWADRFPSRPKTSTASANVHVIDTAFLLPQLKRTRKIWIYLPEDYDKNNTTRYPVLYMQDGQNIFDDATSYAGEWGVDEYMDSAKKKCLIVAIDNGGAKRMNEYNPYDHKRFGKGEGSKYLDFIVKTLKPYIDRKYRTIADKQNTFIAGSSMGGLISMYALLKYPTVFGGAGIFSPSFWITGEGIYKDIKKKGAKVNSCIYFYAGKNESDSMVLDMQKASEVLSTVSRSKWTTVISENGQHNESTWRREFPLFYQWIETCNSKQ